jgi:hypothetical protein
MRSASTGKPENNRPILLREHSSTDALVIHLKRKTQVYSKVTFTSKCQPIPGTCAIDLIEYTRRASPLQGPIRCIHLIRVHRGIPDCSLVVPGKVKRPQFCSRVSARKMHNSKDPRLVPLSIAERKLASRTCWIPYVQTRQDGTRQL